MISGRAWMTPAGVVFLLPWAGCRPPANPRPPHMAARDLVQFSDVTRRAGIHFTHCNGSSGKKYLPETMGSGCAFLDFNQDGWLDLLLLNGRPLAEQPTDSPFARAREPSPTPALYRNNRDGTFTDVTTGSGLDIAMYAMGCCVGDYDNDGRDDVFITTCLAANRLFHNEGQGRFKEVTSRAGVDDARWSTSCAWLDYDRDGWLDLFVCNYVRYRSLRDDKWCSSVRGKKSYCSPVPYDGEDCALYRNMRNGTFQNVSAAVGIAGHKGKALGVAVLDYDQDGWMDLAVANDMMPNSLFHNRGNGTFEEVGLESGFAVAETGRPKAGMGIDAADVSNDGKLSVLVSNFSYEGLSLFRWDGSGFVERGMSSGLGRPSLFLLGFGALFCDFDNDGFRDVFVTNGHVYDEVEEVQSNVTYRQRSQLFRNQRDGNFVDVSAHTGAPFAVRRVGRGAACGDYDNDGDLDLLVTTNNGPAELWRNEGGNRGNWLQLELRGRGGGKTNVSALGVQVRVHADGAVQQDWVRSGSSYLSQSMSCLHFGLGRARHADRVEIIWTTGRRQTLENVTAGRRTIVEPP